MKYIKIVTYDNFPYGGAPANFLRNFSLSLSLNNDNDVEVIMPTGNFYGNKNDLNSSKSGNVENVSYKHLGYIKHPNKIVGKILDNICGYFLPLIYFLKERWKNKVDVIIIYNTTFTRTLIFLFVKFIINRKLIVILPEFYEKPSNKKILENFNWINFYLGIRYLVKYADKFIVLSNYLKKYLTEKNVEEENILILPNILDPEIFELTNVKEHINGKITIGYSGTPTRKDGVVNLIESFAKVTKKHPNTHLLIIGDVVNGNTIIPDLEKIVEKLNISTKVTFTGLVSFKDVPKLLHSCQILTLTRPSGEFAEAGFPTKLGEYFACKKPVVITRVGDIPIYFSDKEHVILVKPNDIDSIVEGFEKILFNDELSKKLSANGFNWMDQNLNYRNISPKLNNFICLI